MSNTKSLDDILNDVKLIKRDIPFEVGKVAKNDFELAHRIIVKEFYSSYSPNTYKRKNELEKVKSNVVSSGGKCVVNVSFGSFLMSGNYRRSPDDIFDLIWNRGIRGLPPQGDNPLNKSFEYVVNGNLINWGTEGEIWINPYWSGAGDPYHNKIKVKVVIDGISTSVGIPNKVMDEFADKWQKKGEKLIDEIVNKIL